jgi:hypothetical protein
MATDRLRRLAEEMKKKQPAWGDDQSNPLDALLRDIKAGRQWCADLRVALQGAIERWQRAQDAESAPNWRNLRVGEPERDTLTIENDSPYIVCTMKFVEENFSLQGTVRVAEHAESKAAVEAPIRIDLKTDNAKRPYKFDGHPFSILDNLAEAVLAWIIKMSNQQPILPPSADIVDRELQAEVKRRDKAMRAEWDRNLRARRKRELKRKSGR